VQADRFEEFEAAADFVGDAARDLSFARSAWW